MFTSSGTLIYYDSYWLILRCCDELAKYYRRSLRKKCLAAPPFGSHITVINGSVEKPYYTEFWRKYEGQTVEFRYHHNVLSESGYYWLTVECEQLHDIREELGLQRNLLWPLHITVAKDAV